MEPGNGNTRINNMPGTNNEQLREHRSPRTKHKEHVRKSFLVVLRLRSKVYPWRTEKTVIRTGIQYGLPECNINVTYILDIT